MRDKNKIYFQVCCAVLKLEQEEGHLNWNYTSLAKTSGINRTLIYYYFGKDKEPILIEAYYFISNVFFNSVLDGHTGSIRSRLKKIISHFEEMPYIFVLYYLNKNSESEIGNLIKAAEHKFLNYLQTLFPTHSQEEIFKIYLMELGAIAYHLPLEKIDQLFP